MIAISAISSVFCRQSLYWHYPISNSLARHLAEAVDISCYQTYVPVFSRAGTVTI